MATVFGRKASDKGFILQSLHMKFSMGANTIFIYGSYGNDPEIHDLLLNLNSSSIQFIDYVLPEAINQGHFYYATPDVKNCTRNYAHPLQYLDCQYRNMYLYRYLAGIDLDEFIYSNSTDTNTVKMLDDLRRKSEKKTSCRISVSMVPRLL